MVEWQLIYHRSPAGCRYQVHNCIYDRVNCTRTTPEESFSLVPWVLRNSMNLLICLFTAFHAQGDCQVVYTEKKRQPLRWRWMLLMVTHDPSTNNTNKSDAKASFAALVPGHRLGSGFSDVRESISVYILGKVCPGIKVTSNQDQPVRAQDSHLQSIKLTSKVRHCHNRC